MIFWALSSFNDSKALVKAKGYNFYMGMIRDIRVQHKSDNIAACYNRTLDPSSVSRVDTHKHIYDLYYFKIYPSESFYTEHNRAVRYFQINNK